VESILLLLLLDERFSQKVSAASLTALRLSESSLSLLNRHFYLEMSDREARKQAEAAAAA
jgi:hypothetical protein